jgi:hypothetical protein
MNIEEQVRSVEVPPLDYSKKDFKIISYTQYSMWKQCPYKWKLSYIDGHKTPQNIHFTFGTSLHETIQEYLIKLYGNENLSSWDIHGFFLKTFTNLYKEKSQQEGHHSTPEELKEFANDGLNIIDFFLENKDKYYQPHFKLLGIEMPLLHPPHSNFPTVKFYGKLDVVLYDPDEEIVIIEDIKTSTAGWNKYQKQDKIKISQLPLYKRYFQEVYGISVKHIDVRYTIVKRKINENAEYPAMRSRMQAFTPPSGTPTLNKLEFSVREFIEDCFDQGTHMYKQKEYEKIANAKNCKWCPFKDKPELCDRNKKKK